MPLFFMPKGRNQYEQDSRTPSYFDDYEKRTTKKSILSKIAWTS